MTKSLIIIGGIVALCAPVSVSRATCHTLETQTCCSWLASGAGGGVFGLLILPTCGTGPCSVMFVSTGSSLLPFPSSGGWSLFSFVPDAPPASRCRYRLPIGCDNGFCVYDEEVLTKGCDEHIGDTSCSG